MLKFSADFIFSISSAPIQNGVVIVNDEGEIIDVLSSDNHLDDVQHFNGIICPGFVNSHCHLELSHLKGKIPEKKGLVSFLQSVVKNRGENMDVIKEAMMHAEREMLLNGIVGIGDISNTSASFSMKKKGILNYHTFIEILGFHPKDALHAIDKGIRLIKEYPFREKMSLSPHAFYSVSDDIFRQIKSYSIMNEKNLISIHNQESEEENKLFQYGTGELLNMMNSMQIQTDFWKPTHTTSLQSMLPYLSEYKKVMLVHNTYTWKEDITATNYFNHNIYWCFCPNANLYIENILPKMELFTPLLDDFITIGTDSLASNKNLSVLDELKTLSEHFPNISLEKLLKWASLNGAKFFGWDKELGSIEKGKKPGLNLISNLDVNNLKLIEKSTVKPLLL